MSEKATKILTDLQFAVKERHKSNLALPLEESLSLLPALSKEHYMRSVDHVLAGTIATVAETLGNSENPSLPIIMVCDPATISNDAANLKIVLDLLEELGYLTHPLFAEKKPARRYLCLKRLRNAEANGHKFPTHLQSQLTIDAFDAQTQSLVCVQSCSTSCKYRSQCRYQHLRQRMISGEIQFQVYTKQMYQNALKENCLPKARKVILNPEGYFIADNKPAVLKRHEVEKLLTQCEYLCSSAKLKKRAVYAETTAIRSLLPQLYFNPALTINQAAKILTEMHDRFVRIETLCSAALTLGGSERAAWRRRLKQTIKLTEELSNGPVKITNQSLTESR